MSRVTVDKSMVLRLLADPALPGVVPRLGHRLVSHEQRLAAESCCTGGWARLWPRVVAFLDALRSLGPDDRRAFFEHLSRLKSRPVTEIAVICRRDSQTRIAFRLTRPVDSGGS